MCIRGAIFILRTKQRLKNPFFFYSFSSMVSSGSNFNNSIRFLSFRPNCCCWHNNFLHSFFSSSATSSWSFNTWIYSSFSASFAILFVLLTDIPIDPASFRYVKMSYPRGLFWYDLISALSASISSFSILLTFDVSSIIHLLIK